MNPGSTYIIGAASDCDIILDHPSISGRHARLVRTGDQFLIEDLDSRNGLFIEGARVKSAVIAFHQQVSLGSQPFTIEDLLHRATSSSGKSGPAEPSLVREVEVGEVTLTIGRDPDASLQVVDDHVSSFHARVYESGGRVIIEDLGSRNGTLVQLEGTDRWESYRTCTLKRGDLVRVGSETFRFRAAESARKPGARLDVRGVSYTVVDRATGQPRKLLNDISFTALDGEVVGILGPSGSGKTTLLNVVVGFATPSEGSVLVQGADLHADLETRRLVGHAPQFDVAHATLTVAEAVRYSALLRGSADWTSAEIEARVDRAIADVGLDRYRDTPLGSDVKKTLSGGQKKRVNIAMELVLDPPVLLLDEPTSGLSAHDTTELMLLLRRLAGQGRTILLTIHQPSYSCYVMMDQVVLLEEGGHLAWFGPAAVDSFEFFDVKDREPGALLERMPRKADPTSPGDIARRYARSPAFDRMVKGRAHELEAHPPPAWPVPRLTSPIVHTAKLFLRGLTMKLRDPFFLFLVLPAPALVSVLFVYVLGAQLESATPRTAETAEVEHQFLLVLTIMTCLFGALASSLEIVQEIPILRREKRGGVGILAYLSSKVGLYLIPSLIFPAVAIGICHLLAKDIMSAPLLEQWVVLAATFFAAACAGLLLSSLVTSPETVIVLAVFYAIVQVVFAAFAPLEVTFEKEPRHRWLLVASAPITARWSLLGLVSVSDLCSVEPLDQNNGATPTPEVTPPFEPACARRMYQRHGIEEAEDAAARTQPKHLAWSLGVNVSLALCAIVLAALSLRRKASGIS